MVPLRNFRFAPDFRPSDATPELSDKDRRHNRVLSDTEQRTMKIPNQTNSKWETKRLSTKANNLAPDTSEIRLLAKISGVSLCHCTLHPRVVSKAIRHKTVEEIWYFMQGQGHVWRKLGDQEEIVDVTAGVSVTIPVGTHFQFRNIGWEPLCFLCVTIPPWPGKDEAIKVDDYWKNQNLG
jgi:mannose-6-phosphate isomerase-like protein (cupin superfamily)